MDPARPATDRSGDAFCGFEGLLGVYWPSIAMLRSSELDDAQRSSTMSVFRFLLNVLVIGVLLLVGQLPERLIFGMALAMLLTCAANVSIIQVRAPPRRRRLPNARPAPPRAPPSPAAAPPPPCPCCVARRASWCDSWGRTRTGRPRPRGRS